MLAVYVGSYLILTAFFSTSVQRHHATKSAAAGYCYINDIVLSILELQQNPLFEKKSILSSAQSSQTKPKRLKKILYIDLDLHHGDGVADAFETNPNVVTVSLHLWSKGFYPSSESISDACTVSSSGVRTLKLLLTVHCDYQHQKATSSIAVPRLLHQQQAHL